MVFHPFKIFDTELVELDYICVFPVSGRYYPESFLLAVNIQKEPCLMLAIHAAPVSISQEM
jgi:hypothetical protein